MGTKSQSIILVLVVLFLTSLIVLPPTTVKANPKTIVVPDDYSTIQSAIDQASVGDTILVRKGVYNGTLYMDKPLSLIGENSQTTVITASGSSMFTRYIIVIGSSVTVSGFTILGSDLSGIYASGDLNNDLFDCKIIGNNLINAGIDVADGAYVFGGIKPSNKLQNTISGNNITGQGIFVESSNTEVSGNNVANNPIIQA